MSDGKKWGRKLFLITPSEWDRLKRSEATNPKSLLEKSSADYKSQLEGEKIQQQQTQTVLDKEKRKKEFSDILKPVLNETLPRQINVNKEKVKRIFLEIENLPKVNLTADNLVIEDQKLPLDELIEYLLSSKSDYDHLKPLLGVLKEARINPRIIPNETLRERLLKEEADAERKNAANVESDISSESPVKEKKPKTPFQTTGERSPNFYSSNVEPSSEETKPFVQTSSSRGAFSAPPQSPPPPSTSGQQRPSRSARTEDSPFPHPTKRSAKRQWKAKQRKTSEAVVGRTASHSPTPSGRRSPSHSPAPSGRRSPSHSPAPDRKSSRISNKPPIKYGKGFKWQSF